MNQAARFDSSRYDTMPRHFARPKRVGLLFGKTIFSQPVVSRDLPLCYRIWPKIPPFSLIITPLQETTPGDEQSKTKTKGQVYHRGTLDTTTLGRYAFQTTQKQMITRGPRKRSTGSCRHRTSWTTIALNKGRTRAEPSRTGVPSPWAEHLCDPGEACCPDTIC